MNLPKWGEELTRAVNKKALELARVTLREKIVEELKPMALLADIDVYLEDSARHGKVIVMRRKGRDWGVVTESYDSNDVKSLLANLANNL